MNSLNQARSLLAELRGSIDWLTGGIAKRRSVIFCPNLVAGRSVYKSPCYAFHVLSCLRIN